MNVFNITKKMKIIVMKKKETVFMKMVKILMILIKNQMLFVLIPQTVKVNVKNVD